MDLLMSNYEKYVTIKTKDLERLLNDNEFCLRLEQAGVDNWTGFGYAHDKGYGHSEDKDYWEFCDLSLLDKCNIANIKVYELYG
jgi:hypothetical protein